MSTDVAVGTTMLIAVLLLAAQAAYHRRQDEAAAEVWSRLAQGVLDDLKVAQRRALVAEATVNALSNDLATERRSHMLTRTALLEAEGELMPLRAAAAEVVAAFDQEVAR